MPNVATTLTDVPGHVFVGQVDDHDLARRMLNEFSFQFSGNAIKSEYGEGVNNRRDQFDISVPELYDKTETRSFRRSRLLLLDPRWRVRRSCSTTTIGTTP